MFALALFGTAAAYNATTTVDVTSYFTTYCSTPTTFAYGGSTYTVSEATTLTISDCSCTDKPTAAATAATPTVPALANGANAAKVGAAAGVAAAVAYML